MGFQRGESLCSRSFGCSSIAGCKVRPKLGDLGGDQLFRTHGAALKRPVIHFTSPKQFCGSAVDVLAQPGRLTQFGHELRRLWLS